MEPTSNLKVKTQNSKPQVKTQNFSEQELTSLFYHDIFDYPLTLGEFIKWESGTPLRQGFAGQASIKSKNGYYFLNGREGLVYKRLIRQRISKRKLLIAKSAAKILRFIPTIKMVGVTGALAMRNASEESDIDLMIITKRNSLWLTRLCVYFTLYALRFKLRRPLDGSERDALCLNMWLDESALVWSKKDRNIYTAHEICQIVPLVNKEKTYEKFFWKNRWIKEYWPNAVRMNDEPRIMNYAKKQRKPIIHGSYSIIRLVEKLAFRVQYQYMKSKMTREVVTPTRAIFHPHDWGKIVLSRLNF